MHSGPPRRRRARPVADASLDALLDRSEDLAKGWLLALLEEAPLDDAPRILATDLTREGPRVCEAVLRAIGSDADQRRLEPEGPLAQLAARVGVLAGATGARDTAHAVDALQEVMWAALRAELRDPDPELVSQLAERLAQVTAVLRGVALGSWAGYDTRDARPTPGAGVPGPVMGVRPSPGPEGPAPVPEARPGPRDDRRPPGANSSTHTLSAVPPPTPGPTPGAARGPAPAPPAPEPRLRAWVGGEPPPAEPAALWVGALAEEIARAGAAPLSLLLAELEDADRVLAVEAEPDATFNDFTQALRRAVRRQDMLVNETSSRAWVIARDTDRDSARSLAERIAASVGEARPWRGAPLVASVGFAVLGQDGFTPVELIQAAEEARFAAAAGAPF
jgi:GGDEF domain-containing protein